MKALVEIYDDCDMLISKMTVEPIEHRIDYEDIFTVDKYYFRFGFAEYKPRTEAKNNEL